jgi:hypothetical protein
MHLYPFFCTQGKPARSVNTECEKSVIRNSEEAPLVVMTIDQNYTYAAMKTQVLLNVFTGDYKSNFMKRQIPAASTKKYGVQ